MIEEVVENKEEEGLELEEIIIPKDLADKVRDRYLQICAERKVRAPSRYSLRNKIPKSTLCAFINGSYKNISLNTLEKVLKSLGMSAYDFFNNDYFK